MRVVSDRGSAAVGLLVAVSLLGASAIFETLTSTDSLNPYIHHIVTVCGINAILTLSLNLLCGLVGQFSLGHAAFMAVGAYTSAYLTVILHVPFLVAVAASGAVGAVFGFLIGIPSFRTKGFFLGFITLGFNLLLINVIENTWAIGGARGMSDIPTRTTLPLVCLAVIAAVVIVKNILVSNLGRSMGAIREDESAAELVGINPIHFKLMAIAVAGFLAAIAGSLYAHYFSFIHPSTFAQAKSTDILTMVYLGGVGSISGSVAGALLVTLFLEILRPFGIWRLVLMPALLVLMIIVRPQGLLGGKEWRFIMDLRNEIRPAQRRPEEEVKRHATP